jgi:hypoxanthine phosphoribosyltransferase
LCLGKLGDGWVIASESVALDAIGAEFVRDVAPGEIITITAHGKLHSSFFGETKRIQHSLFEYVYFARPDSFINGRRVRAGREESGRLLGERIKSKGLKLDVVVPIFESGYPAARGVARSLQIPLVDAITTSNYVGRTFIQPGQENRTRAVSGKHNIVPDEIVGKKIVVVDDSAVRLTTSRSLIESLKDARISIHPAEKPLTIEENWSRITGIQKNEYITMIGHDDILFPNYLKSMDDLIRRHPKATLYQTHFSYIDLKGSIIRNCKPMDEVQSAGEFLSFFLANLIDTMGTGFLMRAKDYDSCGGIPPRYPNLLFADFELYINLTRMGYKATSFEPGFSFRLHQSMTTTSSDLKFHDAIFLFELENWIVKSPLLRT